MTVSTNDFFCSRSGHMIDLRHPSAVLAIRMSRQKIEASLAHPFARQARPARRSKTWTTWTSLVPPFLSAVVLLQRRSAPLTFAFDGVPPVPQARAFNESDEDVCQRWWETPTWQYFSDLAYFEYRGPCDPSLLVKFLKLIGEEGVEELLARTIEVAVTLKLIAKNELSQIIVDSNVQEKFIAHPSDSGLLGTARTKLVKADKAEGIELKQTYAKEAQLLGYKVSRYAHACQYKRMRKLIPRQSTIVGSLQRKVGRKMSSLGLALQETLGHTLSQAQRLILQTASKKNPVKQGKLYSWNAPEVECICNEESRTPNEFGVKVGIATKLQGNLIVCARSFSGNPSDGHTLNERLEQASILMQAIGIKPESVYVNLGYRGVDQANLGIDIKHRGKFKSLTEQEKNMLKRRQAI